MGSSTGAGVGAALAFAFAAGFFAGGFLAAGFFAVAGFAFALTLLATAFYSPFRALLQPFEFIQLAVRGITPLTSSYDDTHNVKPPGLPEPPDADRPARSQPRVIMAFNPFNFFRKNQKILFALLTILVMFMFVLSSGLPGSDFFQWFPEWLGRHKG